MYIHIITIMLMSHPSIDKYFFGQVYHGLCVHDVVNLYSELVHDNVL